MNIVRLMLLSRQMKNRRHEKDNMVTGIPPLTFTANKKGLLKNYRIYGNTVNGESVGDKTVNILPLSRTPLTEIKGDFLCEYDGLGTFTLTTDKDSTAGMEFVIPLMRNFTIPVSVGQGGTGCWQMNNTLNYKADLRLNYNEINVDSWGLYEVNRRHSSYISMGNKVINNISICVGAGNTQKKIVISPAFVENVTEQVPFEPYGYKIPVTLTADSAETTDIYLDEPLAKSGNNADYIDYATQKRHNSDGTESSATLPEIAVAVGTNTLTVGTEVQPSRVELTGRIKEAQTNGSGNT